MADRCDSDESYDSYSENAKHGPDQDQDTSRKDVIARKETVNVNRVRALLAIVLLASTLIVALSVYYYTSNTEVTQFEDQYNDDALKVLEETGKLFESTLSNVDTFATSIVSYSRVSNQTWPFVTIPDFAIRAAKLRTNILGFGVFFIPIVLPSQLKEWEEYAWTHQDWITDALNLQGDDMNFFGETTAETNPQRRVFGGAGENIPYNVTRRLMPEWQQYPVVSSKPNYNYDWLSAAVGSEVILALLDNRKAGMSITYLLPDPNNPKDVAENELYASWNKQYIRPEEEPNEPVFDLHYPVVDKLDSIQAYNDNFNITQYPVVATISSIIYWRDIIRNILPPGRRGIVLVVESPCNPSFTYQLDGPSTVYLGRGDKHDPKFDYLEVSSSFFNLQAFYQTASKYSGLQVEKDQCPITIRVYPSDTMKSDYTTKNPAIFASVTVLIFAFASLVFILYDFNVERRQKLVLTSALTTNAIVSSLFPSTVRDQMLTEQNTKSLPAVTQDVDGDTVQGRYSSKPIAHHYPDTTILFADISGFTAWSSVRDPQQVFILLETLFGSFDRCAKLRNVFKVETIGDCYVAVTGLPDPNPNHAVSMSKFARDCIDDMVKITGELAVTLGPGTSNLKLRVGLNSGPTIAGVLRGEKSRFQLFGDTINTASRMESTGTPGRIHASAKTAALLVAAGKDTWVSERSELVEAKGKGMMRTYWIWPKSAGTSVTTPSDSEPACHKEGDMVDVDKTIDVTCLVDWNVDIFLGLLKKVVAKHTCSVLSPPDVLSNIQCNANVRMPVEDVTDRFDMQTLNKNEELDNQHVYHSQRIEGQVRDYITSLAFMHKEHPFHNFEHASHVVMSAVNLLQKIKVPKTGKSNKESTTSANQNDLEEGLVDPLTQLAVLFAAMILNTDHPGVSNNQLVHQQDAIALFYKGRSVAEQNSFEMAWNLLMEPSFADLRSSMFANEDDFKCFRQIAANLVMATDIFDSDAQLLRESRREKAFGIGVSQEVSNDNINLQVLIVLEDVIIASKFVHTMQHWSIYQSWSKKLFQEMYSAYRLGQSSTDLSKEWYMGELNLFDQYIIPLVNRFSAYGVFGLSCEDFMACARDNRKEWENHGRYITENLLSDVEAAWDNE